MQINEHVDMPSMDNKQHLSFKDKRIHWMNKVSP